METEWHVARARLRDLLQQQPEISHAEAAKAIGYSKGWVRKWRKRIATNPADEGVLCGLSRRPHRSPTRIPQAAEECVVELRTSLAEIYHRTVGARTIFAHLRLVKDLTPLGRTPPQRSGVFYDVANIFTVLVCVYISHWYG
jgi:hypothetical protein